MATDDQRISCFDKLYAIYREARQAGERLWGELEDGKEKPTVVTVERLGGRFSGALEIYTMWTDFTADEVETELESRYNAERETKQWAKNELEKYDKEGLQQGFVVKDELDGQQ